MPKELCRARTGDDYLFELCHFRQHVIARPACPYLHLRDGIVNLLCRRTMGKTMYRNQRCHMIRNFAVMLAVPVLVLVAARAPAQTVVYAAPAYCPQAVSYYAPAVSYYSPVSYYAPPAASSYYSPTVSYYAAPTASYYPNVSYYATPAVSYYSPAYYAPVTTYYRYGLFGRRIGAVTYYP